MPLLPNGTSDDEMSGCRPAIATKSGPALFKLPPLNGTVTHPMTFLPAIDATDCRGSPFPDYPPQMNHST